MRTKILAGLFLPVLGSSLRDRLPVQLRCLSRTVSMMSDSKSFFKLKEFAVVGASTDREKFGNKVLRCYIQHGYAVTPISKRQNEIEGLKCVGNLTDLVQIRASGIPPSSVTSIAANIGVSIITPPSVTRSILEEGYSLGYRNFFLQPGTVDKEGLDYISTLPDDVNVLRGCVLVDLGISG